MFGSHILETFAGLAFIFLLLSVFASSLNEWIAALFSLRASDLETALKNLLAEDASPVPAGGQPDAPAGQGVATALLNHSLIQNLSAPKLFGKGITSPAYLDAKVFSSTLFSLLLPGQGQPSFEALRNVVANMKNDDLKKSLQPLLERAAGSVDAARKNIEDWYDSAMDRLSGRYKRRTQCILFVLGLILAIVLNVDTLRVTKKLWDDPVLREHMLEQAKKQQPPPANSTAAEAVEKAAHDVTEAYSSADMPFGWNADALTSWKSHSNAAHSCWSIFKVLLGWFLTAMAVCLGAPFWFDLLNKTLGLNARLSGEKPAKSSS